MASDWLRTRGPVVVTLIVGGGLLCAYVYHVTRQMDLVTYDTWGGYIVAPLIVALTLPVAVRESRRTGDARIAAIMMWALLLKLAASVVRYRVAFDVYDGTGDALLYAERGASLAASFRALDFDVTILGKMPGTGFIEVLTGAVYTVTGPTIIGGFLVFAWFSYWGSFLLYRGLRIAIPDADHRRYALLVFLMPSLLFWPSSIGKESWMLFGLGLASFGVAKILARESFGVLSLSAGITSVAMVRPHMAVLVWAGFMVVVMRRRSKPSSVFGPFIRIATIAVVIALGGVLLQQAETFFNVDDGIGEASAVLDEASRRTTQGGSEFQATRVTSITDVPAAIMAVAFRPFPHEAHNMQALIASLEGTTLLILFLMTWDRLKDLPRTAWRHPYVLFSILYALLFVVAFSSFGNFGIIARQRVQLFPFLFVLLALPRGLPERVPTERVEPDPGPGTPPRSARPMPVRT